MNPQHPPPPLLPLLTIAGILKLTTTTVRHHLPLFLILSTSLLAFRIQLESSIQMYNDIIDNDPGIKSYFRQIQHPTHGRHHRHRHHHFPEDDPRFFGSPPPKPQPNATSLILDSFNPQFGFSNNISDNGIRVYETVRSTAKLSFRLIEKEKNISVTTGEKKNVMPLFLTLSAAYFFLWLAFVASQCMIHGIVFLFTVNNFLNREEQFNTLFQNGIIIGLRRLYFLFTIRYFFRLTLTRILGVIIFGKIYDQHTNYKIFSRLNFMPLSTSSPLVYGFENEFYSFMLYWFLLDILISLVFSVLAFMVMAEPINSFREVIQEGWNLFSLSVNSAINLQWLSIVCGSFLTSIIEQIFGKIFGYAFKSLMEVYFVVAWIMYYFSVKSTDAYDKGEPFGQAELAEMIDVDI